MSNRGERYEGRPENEEKSMWARWRKGSNTAEIARAFDRPEHGVERVIARRLDARDAERKI